MIENNRFTLIYKKIGEYFNIGIVDHETKEPFDEALYEFHPDSFEDSRDEMEDLCLLLNELNDENKLLKEQNQELYVENHDLKQELKSIRELIGNMIENERTKLGKSVLIQLWEQIR